MALYKTFSSIFDLSPLTPKIESRKCNTKSPISPLVYQIGRRCLRLLGGFSVMADLMEPCKMLWCRPLLPWQRKLGKFGLLFHKKIQIDSSFLFLDGIEPFFWSSVLHEALYKTLFFDFSFRPPNAQNLLPQIACDNATLPRRHPWSRSRHGSSAWGKSAIH